MTHFIRMTVMAWLVLQALQVNAADYRYINYELGITHPENHLPDGKYTSASASFDMNDGSFIIIESTDYEKAPQYNYDMNAFGFGAYTGIGRMTDIYGIGQIVTTDLGDDEEASFRITIGIRNRLADRLEFALKAEHEYISSDASKTYTVELRNYLTRYFSVGASYEKSEINALGFDVFYGSVRLNF